MESQYCRLFFACQSNRGYASTHAKKGPPHLCTKMNRYSELKLPVLVLYVSTSRERLGLPEAAAMLDFLPARSVWTYLKRLSSFSLLERRSRGRGTLEYRISELGQKRLRWLRSQRG